MALELVKVKYNSLLMVLSASLMMSSCSYFFNDINVDTIIGRDVNIKLLEKELVPGVSSQNEVLRALGTPAGKGREMFPMIEQPRTVWTYYYSKGNLDDSRQLMLYIFFDKTIYDGYMWFSSFPRDRYDATYEE